MNLIKALLCFAFAKKHCFVVLKRVVACKMSVATQVLLYLIIAFSQFILRKYH